MVTLRRYLTRRSTLFLVILAMASVLLVVVACGGGASATSTPTDTPPDQAEPTATSPAPQTGAVGGNPSSQPAGTGSQAVDQGRGSTVGELASGSGTTSLPAVGSAVQYTANQQLGIWVNGRGVVSAAPDLAILNAGVEASGKTVEEARSQVAIAMDAVMQVLRDLGIEDRDIRTTSFNIFPEYTFNEVRRRQELIGYRVSNQLSIRIRDLDSVGLVIDQVAAAAGDLVKVQGVGFTIEDTEALAIQARAEAVNDLMAKARQLAELTGVRLGPPVFLSEGGVSVPRPQTKFRGDFAEAAIAVPQTVISGGELDVVVSVQGVFTIEE